MPRPFAQPVTLSDDVCATLTAWARRPKTAQALALRARIVLAAAEPGTTNTAIAARLGITKMTGHQVAESLRRARPCRPAR